MTYMHDMATHAVEGTLRPRADVHATGHSRLRWWRVACWPSSCMSACGSSRRASLVLFYRLGRQIRLYLYAWWACAAPLSSWHAGVASVGLNQYGCIFGDITTIFATCLLPGSLHDIYVHEVVASLLDMISDVLSKSFPSQVYAAGVEKEKAEISSTMMLIYTIYCTISVIILPIWILWSTRVNFRQKLVFSAIFCLVGLTVTITIIRGAFAKIIIDDPKNAP